MKVSSVQSPNFQGIPVTEASIAGLKSKYKLYEVTSSDAQFLTDLYNSVNLKELMPNMSEHHYYLWDGFLKYALEFPIDNMKKILIETCDNIPCGVMKYLDGAKMFHVDYVVTFPDKPEHRVPYAGQVLFNELFRRFMNSDAQKIELSASRNAPFSPVSKYLKLGFSMLGGDEFSELMRINRERVAQSIDRQKKFLSALELNYPKDVNLSKIISLNA